jgi:hypothetical protein
MADTAANLKSPPTVAAASTATVVERAAAILDTRGGSMLLPLGTLLIVWWVMIAPDRAADRAAISTLAHEIRELRYELKSEFSPSSRTQTPKETP